MSKKRRKQYKRKSNKIWYIGILIVAIFIALGLIAFKNRENSEELQLPLDIPEKMQPISVGQDIEVTNLGKYTGAYMEDGSDEVVEDVLMAIVKNNGQNTLQYAELYMNYGESTAEFSLSTLPPGESVVILEKNRMSSKSEEPDFVYLENVVFFQEEISMHEDLFEITSSDGILNIKNISSEDITGDIFIYYKNFSVDKYYGGITYRARVENGLAKDELKQVAAMHYSSNGSKLLMVTYNE